MNNYEIPSLLELATKIVVQHLKDYSVSQIDSVPVNIKDEIRVKSLRKQSNLSPKHLSALLHPKVHSLELSLIREFNADHVCVLQKVPKLVSLNSSKLRLEQCNSCDRVRLKINNVVDCCCKRISRQLRSSLMCLPCLVKLDLSYNPRIIEDSLILSVCETSPNLQQLELNGCCKITDKSIIHQAETEGSEKKIYSIRSGLVCLASLQSLGLSGTSITDQGLQDLSKYSKSSQTLTEIVLNKCDKITDEGIECMLDTFNVMEIFSFAHCKNVSMKSVNKLSDYFERRRSENLNEHTVNAQMNRMKQISFSIW